MTLRYIQGMESVRNSTDFISQGWTTNTPTSGLRPFGIPSTKIAGTQALRFESSSAASADLSPTFAGGNSSTQFNTGITINELWTKGGFSFGTRCGFRDTINSSTIGFQVPAFGTGIVNQSPANRIIWDGTKYWSLRIDANQSVVTVCTSTDLITWTDTVAQPTLLPFSISFVNGIVVVSCQNFTIARTTTGTTWTNTAIFTGVTNQAPVSNVVFANAKYYISSGSNTAGSPPPVLTLTSPDLVTWTQIDSFAATATNNVHPTLFFDPQRSRIFQLLTTNGGATDTFARVRSFNFSNAVTTNLSFSAIDRVGPSSIAVSTVSGTAAIVVSLTNGQVFFATGANPTSWTGLTAAQVGLPSVTDTAHQCIAYDPTIDRFVIAAPAGAVAISNDNTGATWTVTNPISTTIYNVGTTYINNKMIATGQSVMVGSGVIANGVLTYGWDVKYWTETVVAANSGSSTFQGSSRLGFAAINSGGRSSFVGLMPSSAINTSTNTAAIAVSVNNTTSGADAGSETYSVSTLNKYNYYELVATATATVNQFSVQVVINGNIVSSSAFIVAIAPTADTTSTLFLTLPIRNSGVSALPSWISFDDMYLLDFAGTVNNTPMKDCTIIKDNPTGDVQAQFTKTPATAATNSVVASAASVSTASGQLSSQSTGAQDIYSVANTIDLSAFSVKAVAVEATFSNSTLASSTVKVGMLSGAAAVDTGTVTVPNGSSLFASKIQELDPNTAIAWTRTNAIAAQITVTKVT